MRQRPRRRLGKAALALLLLLVLAVAILWLFRVELARAYIDAELARRGVRASYEIKRIGFGSQIFEKLVIGDPRRPDFTARHVEVQVVLGFTGPRVGLITADGVRMAGRIENGRLKLGEIDKLLPPPSNAPFRLPDQRVDVRDAALDLTTPAGRVRFALSGRGNLADGFRGGIEIVSRELRFGQCVLTRPVARLSLRIADRKPRVHGPAAMARLACGDDLDTERPLFALQAMLEPGLDHWRGAAATRIAALRAGPQRLAAVEGHVSFDGDANRTAGDISVDTGAAAVQAFHAAQTRFAAHYAMLPRRGDLSLEGRLVALGLAWDGADAAAATLARARGSPLGPIGEALAVAVRDAGRAAAAVADIEVASTNGAGQARFRRFSLVSASGARLQHEGGGIAYRWPGGALLLDGDFALSGGGFPEARFHLVQASAGGPMSGNGRIAPMTAGDARLALGEIEFLATPGGETSFRTTALVDGPFNGGRVRGFAMPVSGRFGASGFALGEVCVTAAFEALEVQRLAIGSTRLALCPIGRAMVADGRLGVELRGPGLNGYLGRMPVALAAERVRVESSGFAATQLTVGAGVITRVSRMAVADLSGRFVGGGAAGRFEGAAGQLAGLPLLIRGGRGDWRLSGGDLALDGSLTVADALDPVRFHPLASEGFHLAMSGNRVHATAPLIHPASHTRIALATIDHDLASGAGHARFDVPELRFTPAFQPQALTPLTLRTASLVDGVVTGQGRVEWDAQGVRSSGTFSTDDLDVATPFAPVQGLATTIHFTDLLELASAPHQEARIRLIQPGIQVFDGVIRYELRPDYHVVIESALWPLAGGTLAIEPAVLDFSRESTKSLTFRVDGLDAARVVQLVQASNAEVTGTFDGVIPMEFTRQRGGVIRAGRLAARPGGGTLTYLGPLSERIHNEYARLAFDALRSLRYNRLAIALDGALGGEFVALVSIDGISRTPQAGPQVGRGLTGIVAGRALDQLTRIPFRFNIRASGPFRLALATLRTYQSPRDLNAAALIELMGRPGTIVQIEESEPVP